jgi:hypothetical protein
METKRQEKKRLIGPSKITEEGGHTRRDYGGLISGKSVGNSNTIITY